MNPKQIPGVPLQTKGGFHDTESSKPYRAEEAHLKFNILKERFFSINKWKDYSGGASADFKHFSSSGRPVDRVPDTGDLIRISIPGFGSKQGKRYDWVEIVNISHRKTDDAESYLMRCRPSPEPNRKKGPVAHFYRSSSTSNIMISKEGHLLKAAIYGRNEQPNFDASFLDRIRNLLIGVGGILGFGKIQWKLLAEGLLNFE